MDYKPWLELIGKQANDKHVSELLTKAGIKPVILKSDEISIARDIKGEGFSLLFTDGSVLKPDEGGLIGQPILSGILMILKDRKSSSTNIFTGALPYDADKNDTQDELRARLGTPTRTINQQDTWIIDGLKVAANYAEDFKSITRMSVVIPGTK